MEDKDNKINEKLKEVVMMRISTLPSDLMLSIGNGVTLTKDEMIERIKKNDPIGKEIIETHLSFLKAVADGKVTKALSSV